LSPGGASGGCNCSSIDGLVPLAFFALVFTAWARRRQALTRR
jgi:uncharacterized protein (TIGR03382 family)